MLDLGGISVIPDETSNDTGLFLQGFNEVEALTYSILELFPEDDLTEHAGNIRQFLNRARFIQALIKSSGIEHGKQLYDLLERAISLSTYRNKLSHNPLRISVFKDSSGSVAAQTTLVGAKGDKEYPDVIEQLPTKIKEITSIVDCLYGVVYEIRMGIESNNALKSQTPEGAA